MITSAPTTWSAADVLHEIAARQMSLVPSLCLWMASVDQNGDTLPTRKRKVRQISATGATPWQAVAALVRRLDAEAQERELFDAGYDY